MRIVTFLILTLTVTACGGRTTDAGTQQTLIHDGIERLYLIERPATSGPAPAIVVLHGGGGTARQIQGHTGFDLTPHGWVEIYPQGVDKSWNDGRTAIADGTPLRSADDIGFLRTLLRRLIADGTIDPDHIYIAGVSNGGAMTQRMVCNAPRLVAGAASVIMTFPVGIRCPDRPPIPMMFILGTKDPLVPYGGGPLTLGRKDRGNVWSAARTYDFYARRNRCGPARTRAMPDTDASDGMRTSKTTWTGCAAPLVALDVEEGGHTWPGTRSRPFTRRIVGPTTRDFSATAEIETFFRRLAGQ